jgi:hypothetical protein
MTASRRDHPPMSVSEEPPGSQGYLSRNRLIPETPRTPTGRDPARRLSRPDGGSLPQRGAPANPAVPDYATLSKRHRAHPADPPSPQRLGLAPKADKTKHSIKDRLLSILNRTERRIFAALLALALALASTDQPFRSGPSPAGRIGLLVAVLPGSPGDAFGRLADGSGIAGFRRAGWAGGFR